MTFTSRTIHSLTSRCKVIIWHYVNQTTPQTLSPQGMEDANTTATAGTTSTSSNTEFQSVAAIDESRENQTDVDNVLSDILLDDSSRLTKQEKEDIQKMEEAGFKEFLDKNYPEYSNNNSGMSTIGEPVTPGAGGDYKVEEIIFDTQYSDCPVVNAMFSKSLGSPAGEFVLQLVNTNNIHKMVSPGDWIAIYLTQGGPTQTEGPSDSPNTEQGNDVPKLRLIASSAGRSPRQTSVTSLGNGYDIATVAYSEPGEQSEYYWTDAQYEKFLSNTAPDRSNPIDASNVLAYADEFNQKVKDGSWKTEASDITDGLSTTKKDSTIWSLRCFGNVNRVSRNETIDQSSGARRVTYDVAGFDFGKVFVRSIIYLNQYITEAALFKASFYNDLLQSGIFITTPDMAVRALLETVIGKNSGADKMTGQAAGTQRVSQWILPNEVSRLFGGASNIRFNDILVTDEDHVKPQPPAYKNISAFLGETTNLWQLLIAHGNLPLNEMFPELDGPPGHERPALFLRYYPYAFRSYKSKNGTLDNFINYFMDLPNVAIDYSHVFESHIGYSDNERCNVFWLGATAESVKMEPLALAMAARGFPKTFENSVERYGTFPSIDMSTYGLMPGQEGGLALDILEDWNDIRVHWLSNQHQLLNGQMRIIGNSDVRIGKRLTLSKENSDWPFDLSFYIISYTDNWKYPGMWTQDLILHRGVYIKDNKETYYYDADDVGDLHIGTNNIKGMQR